MKFHKNSWINELNKKYKKVPICQLDKANEIITHALDELIKLKNKSKNKYALRGRSVRK